MRFAATALFALYAAIGAPHTPGDATQVKDEDVVARMTKGTLEEREETVSKVVAFNLMARSADVRRVVAQELVRMNAEVARRQDNLARGISEPGAPAIGEYMGQLVQACAGTDDPVVIDGLLGAIDTGNMATSALARFGSTVLARVVEIANDERNPLKAFSALETLTKMLATHTVNSEEIGRVIAIARRGMSGEHSVFVWTAIVRLAVATGDPVLLDDVRAIASGTRAVPVAPSDISGERGRATIRRVAQGALAARGRSH